MAKRTTGKRRAAAKVTAPVMEQTNVEGPEPVETAGLNKVPPFNLSDSIGKAFAGLLEGAEAQGVFAGLAPQLGAGFDVQDAMEKGFFKVISGDDVLRMLDGTRAACPIKAILKEVHEEAHRAMEKHAPMHSAHEGISVLREELDELWDEVKADRGYQESARKEAIQIAAMAVRYILDVTDR